MPLMFGKYRGTVTNNVDPMAMARIQVMVPAVAASEQWWAMPCCPFAGPDIGLCLIPPVGANVWVEFEGGDIAFPIWSGCFWGAGEYPAEAQVQQPEMVQVLKGYGFKLVANSVGPTGLTIEVSPPMVGRTLRIVLNESGILVSNEDEMTLKLTESAIEIEVQHKCKISMSSSTLDLSNAGASVKISPVTVNVNNGALEVT